MSTQRAIAQAVTVLLVRSHRSKKWLAAELGMSFPSLSARLAGRTAIDTDDIDAIARALGITGFELLALAEAERQVGGVA